MTDAIVDSNVLVDVWLQNPLWVNWSIRAMAWARGQGDLIVNQIILAEVSVPFAAPGDVEAAMALHLFRRDSLPWEAAFVAGKAFALYRDRGGSRRSPMPDFYIGAHAQLKGFRLVTRDHNRYRTYFPSVELISPETHP
jgi:predicted nucleic acid-binding protein